MKATVNLDEQLYRRVKVTAGEQGGDCDHDFRGGPPGLPRQPAGTVNDALPLQIPIVDGSGGLLPGVDPTDGAELERLINLDRAPGNFR